MNKVFRRFQRSYWLLFSLVSGVVTTLAFAPFDLSWLVFISLATAFYIWDKLPARQAAVSAWLFGMGLHCSGVSWIYYSVHVHGSAPVPFAILLVFLLCCYLSIYPALAAWLVNRYMPNDPVMRLLLFYPAAWVVFEWLQGYVMTGFSWMQLGYTQIEYPLSGFAPVLGNHAVGGAVAVSAGALALLVRQRKCLCISYIVSLTIPVMVLWLSGALLATINWTERHGAPLKVSVIQGNIAQQDKWKPQMKQPTMRLYRELSLAQQDVDLIVWPETAIPDFEHRATPYLQALSQVMEARGTDLLLGIFVLNEEKRVLNSVININGGIYEKRHLVPLGEYIPLRFLIEFFNRFVKIPMSDIASGSEGQPLLTAAGIPLGLSICFEDAFARDVIRDLPEAKLLINFSNDAWFEDSHEPHQHHAIARMRALEAGRSMIRATNTGITALIGPHGNVISQYPQFETGVLKGEIQPYTGTTPFVTWGNGFIVGACSLLLLMFAFKERKKELSTDKHR